MKFSTKSSPPAGIDSPCVAVAVFESRRLSPAAAALDRACAGELKKIVAAGDMDGKCGSTRLLYRLPGVAAERVLLVGMGNEKTVGAKEYRDATRAAIAAIIETGASAAALYLAEIPVRGRNAQWKARHAAMVAEEVAYRFDAMKSKKTEPRPLASVVLASSNRRDIGAIHRGVAQGRSIAAGVSLARDLGNLPSNICTPTHLAQQAEKLAARWKLGVQVLGRKEIENLGMGAFASVARGSREPPRFIVLQYHGARKRDQPVVLVGKGITFDTGGISIKPSAEMDEMKFDMCGAASVLGTMRAVAEMRLALNVVGLVPATENMPGGAASKPGDIVKSLSDQTIEILNTDAEGRLILCDALAYAERFRPQAVVDVATLTGACVVALGHVCCGLFSHKDALARELLAAGEDAWDRAWRLPLWEDYQEQLKSNFADVANIGGRAAGSITAACFLSRFATKFDWAHLDIAGIAWKSGKEKGATGRPVPLLTSFLMKRARE